MEEFGSLTKKNRRRVLMEKRITKLEKQVETLTECVDALLKDKIDRLKEKEFFTSDRQ